MAASHSVFSDWGTSISPYETGRYRTVLLSCDVEILHGTADTLSLWRDLIRNIRWGACRCDGLHCMDRGRKCPVGCSRCHRFFPSQVPKGFDGYCLSFPRHILGLHKVTFGRVVATRGFPKKINVLLQQVCSFCNGKTVFAQAIVFVTRSFASDVVVMNWTFAHSCFRVFCSHEVLCLRICGIHAGQSLKGIGADQQFLFFFYDCRHKTHWKTWKGRD